ncbi:DinB family protein [Polaromonas sp. YR568]|uniref:DinB family protein n=1 Tax=Polaromonas sp. YR568 TaxID=1855301 RepID=UPI00398C1B32
MTTPAAAPLNPATLQAMADFPRQLEQFYEAIPESHRNWTPASWEGIPSETFSALGQICHVRDIEVDGYHLRFERTLAEANPVLASLDGYVLEKERGYAAADAQEVFAAFRAARAKTMGMLSGLTPDALARTAEFEGYGALTLRSLVHYLCSHDQQHLAGLQWLLGKIDASRA